MEIITSPQKTPQYAVRVESGFKSYKESLVLKNLNLNVGSGTIYGLLGASGCGKTTLLSCLVGTLSLDSGHISIFGQDRASSNPANEIGYMPQETGLYPSFTISETFSYFAHINDAESGEWEANAQKLSGLLNLPPWSRRVNNLSGGEQRRLSLACSLLHNPRLLILDEPTVGVDPILRLKVWDYLEEIVTTKGTTVLLSTHYVEETRRCDKIGVLRKGRLIVEESPDSLLQKHNALLLEQVIVDLCKQDDSNNSRLNDSWTEEEADSHKTMCQSYKNAPQQIVVVQNKKIKNRNKKSPVAVPRKRWKRVRALVRRNWINQLRYPVLPLLQFIIPFFNAILGVYIMGRNPTGLKLGVVNNGFGDSAEGHYCSGHNFSTFSACRLLSHVSQSNEIQTIQYSSEADALASVTSGTTLGYFTLPSNYSSSLQERLALGNFADNQTIQGSTIPVHLDLSAPLQSVFVKKYLTSAFFSFATEIVKEMSGLHDNRITEVPLNFTAIYGRMDGDYRDFLLPVSIILPLFLLPQAVALLLIQDRRQGTQQRTLSSRVSYSDILLSHILSEVPTTLIQILTLLLLVWLGVLAGEEITVVGSWPLMFLQCYLVSLSGTSIGLLVGTRVGRELEAMVAMLGMFILCMSAGGCTWPLDTVPFYLRAFSYSLPTASPIVSLRSIMVRGWGLGHPRVLLGLLASSTYILLGVLGALWVHALRN